MPKSEVLFSRKGTRKSFLEKCILFPFNRLLHLKSKRFLLENTKQLVIFSFDHIGHTINLKGLYERENLEVFFYWIESLKIDFSNSIAIDIGANIGNHSIYFSNFFGSAISFEPHPRTYKVLLLNAELSKNINCKNIGLSDANREAPLEENPANMGNSFILEKNTRTAETANLRTLDSLEDFGDVKLIKIDTEGHEYKVIAGARKTIKNNMPIIIFEQSESAFINGETAAICELKDLGYR